MRGRMTSLAGLLALLVPVVGMAQQNETGFLDRTVSVAGLELRYQVYVPADYDTARAWPVVLFLHGSGERGTDGLKQTAVGLGTALRRNAQRFPAIIIFPQAPPDSSWTGAPARAALAALDAVEAAYRTDRERVYLTGLSMGGHGAWYLAYRHPERFAAVVPVCGWVSPHPRFPERAAVVPAEDGAPFEALARTLKDVPVWIFHGELDDAVPVAESRAAAAALGAAGAPVRYTELPGTDHNSWDAAYASVQLTDWLFAQRRSRQ